MRVDANDPTHIIADDGKIFVRRDDLTEYGEDIYLGYTYYINGQKLDVPHKDEAKNFMEVYKPDPDPEECTDDETFREVDE